MRYIEHFLAVSADVRGALAVSADGAWRRWDGSHWATDSSDNDYIIGGRADLGTDA